MSERQATDGGSNPHYNPAFAALAEACQLFTQGLGDAEGYYPMLGAVKTAKALTLMKQAGVKPIFFGDAP